MDILTRASTSYMQTFHHYGSQFAQWGQWLFVSLLTINMVWMCLWYAFDRHSFAESMPSFIKRFFSVAFFYTLMMNPSWLMDVLRSAQGMGKALTHMPFDPSSKILINSLNKLIPVIKCRKI